MMPLILNMKNEGKLNEQQMLWFRQTKPVEELYDCTVDSLQFNNLASDPKFRSKLESMRNAYDRWARTIGDMAEIPEPDMVKRWWNGKDQQPVTATPDVHQQASPKVRLSCATAGSSIGYKFRWKDKWAVYANSFDTNGYDSLYVVAQRIGYAKSDVVKKKIHTK
jgi:hypothetical protein